MTRTVVVVGAGSAGSTAAWRLSEDPGTQVVLVEAGDDPGADVPKPLRNALVLPDRYDWGYRDADTDEPLRRGKVLGGSSAANYRGATRGQAFAYDGWGLADWSWERCLPAFRAVEHDREFDDRPYHGDAGPTPVVRRPLAEPDQALAETYQRHGYGPVPDHNAPDAVGFGPYPANLLENGDRASTLLTLGPALRERENVRIVPASEATRVVVEGGRATGVEIQGPSGPEVVEGDLVLLSAGVYGTPELLVRSGIGPGAALRRLGVPEVLAHDGVGQNLRDHPMILMSVDSPSLQVVGSPLLLTVRDGDDFFHVYPFAGLVPGAPPSTLTFVCALMSPTSVGSLDFTTGRAEVHLRHLDDERDRRAASGGVRRVAELLDDLAGQDHVTVPADAWWRTTDAVEPSTVLSYNHPVGTCRMGDDAGSVVDQGLRVRGVEDLMIADASVLPDIPRSQVNLPTMMIGYRAAELALAR